MIEYYIFFIITSIIFLSIYYKEIKNQKSVLQVSNKNIIKNCVELIDEECLCDCKYVNHVNERMDNKKDENEEKNGSNKKKYENVMHKKKDKEVINKKNIKEEMNDIEKNSVIKNEISEQNKENNLKKLELRNDKNIESIKNEEDEIIILFNNFKYEEMNNELLIYKFKINKFNIKKINIFNFNEIFEKVDDKELLKKIELVKNIDNFELLKNNENLLKKIKLLKNNDNLLKNTVKKNLIENRYNFKNRFLNSKFIKIFIWNSLDVVILIEEVLKQCENHNNLNDIFKTNDFFEGFIIFGSGELIHFLKEKLINIRW